MDVHACIHITCIHIYTHAYHTHTYILERKEGKQAGRKERRKRGRKEGRKEGRKKEREKVLCGTVERRGWLIGEQWHLERGVISTDRLAAGQWERNHRKTGC